jgi:hypothetical protein
MQTSAIFLPKVTIIPLGISHSVISIPPEETIERQHKESGSLTSHKVF